MYFVPLALVNKEYHETHNTTQHAHTTHTTRKHTTNNPQHTTHTPHNNNTTQHNTTQQQRQHDTTTTTTQHNTTHAKPEGRMNTILVSLYTTQRNCFWLHLAVPVSVLSCWYV